jgi:hypothetical protein
LKVGEMPVWSEVGQAVVPRVWMAVDYIQDVTEKLVGLVVVARRGGSRGTDDDFALQGGEEGELALGSGAHDGPEMFETWIPSEDGEEIGEAFTAVALGQLGDGAFFGHMRVP